MPKIKNVPPKKEKKENPYQLVYWRRDWTEKQTALNNTKFWVWEIEHNGLKLP